ncbi:hypothetical protein MB27_17865 [Actinoplanes utahensis]|uniref:Uncharacterized protein n=1 Tax=Actinoplanes utahensis TaxID=1869 RepID=A0A0A6X857_ACTUT|nr:hypothetical protein MB27_17865 [Actinoplanes utahensis]
MSAAGRGALGTAGVSAGRAFSRIQLFCAGPAVKPPGLPAESPWPEPSGRSERLAPGTRTGWSPNAENGVWPRPPSSGAVAPGVRVGRPLGLSFAGNPPWLSGPAGADGAWPPAGGKPADPNGEPPGVWPPGEAGGGNPAGSEPAAEPKDPGPPDELAACPKEAGPPDEPAGESKEAGAPDEPAAGPKEEEPPEGPAGEPKEAGAPDEPAVGLKEEEPPDGPKAAGEPEEPADEPAGGPKEPGASEEPAGGKAAAGVP